MDQFGSELDRLTTLIDKLEGKVLILITQYSLTFCNSFSDKIRNSGRRRSCSRNKWHSELVYPIHAHFSLVAMVVIVLFIYETQKVKFTKLFLLLSR